jgi:hypothetical protein
MKRLSPLNSTLVPVFLLLFAASQYAQNEAIARFNPPKQYYLALGDSLAFGFQLAKFNANLPSVPPSVFATGYADDFALRLRVIRPHRLEATTEAVLRTWPPSRSSGGRTSPPRCRATLLR